MTDLDPDQPDEHDAAVGSASEQAAASEGRGPDRSEPTSIGDDLAESVEDAFEEAVSTAERERDEYLDQLRRLQAEFENYRKRVMRQQAEAIEHAAGDLISALVPVLDAVDLAAQHGHADAVAPVASPLMDVLTKAGLERIDPAGEPFDPAEHEAVAHEPGEGDGGEQVVASTMRAGYRWRGKLVRPAMVSVRG